MILYDNLKNIVKKDEKSTALLYMGKRFSYRELFRGIDNAAARLSTVLCEGDVATICMPNTPECVYCFYALNRLGVIAHMVHPLTPRAQLSSFMAAAHSKLLITLSINLAEYAPLTKDYTIVSIHPARSLGKFKSTLFNTKVKPYRGDMTGIVNFDDLPADALPQKTGRSGDTVGVYLHSGGTNGEPKIIELSDSSINALANRGPEALGIDDVRGMYMLGALPMFHGFGLTMSIHAILTFGGVSVLMPKFNPKTTAKLVKRNKMHFIIGVPNLFRALLKQKDFNGAALKNVYIAFVGGDCAPQDLLDEYNARMEKAGARSRLFEGYGLTETVTVCAVNNYAYNKRTSMGHMLSGLSAIIVDENLKPLPVGQDGEIAVSGDTVMLGYLNADEENNNVFFEHDGKKYVRTGDYGHMDGEGYLYFVTRLKRIIKISGISVYPVEIERCASALDGVTSAAAVEYSDGGKTKIALFLTGNPPPDDVIKKAVGDTLSRYAVPTIIRTLDAIPVTPVFKIDVRALTSLAQNINEGKE